jgi:hypothetical protein
MRLRGTITALSAALALAVVAAPAAHAEAEIGVGEQYASMFSDPMYGSLGIRHARFIAGWDALHSKWQRAEMDTWMAEAQRTGTQVLLSLSRSRDDRRKRRLPSTTRYRREFRAFRARYPFVKAFIPWNEANHCSQPLCNKPAVAAHYFDAMKDECPNCIVLAADVLDQKGMVAWVREFKRHVRHHATRWGLHNYIDANRFQSSGTRAMLDTVKGDIWFTETGGLVKRRNPKRNPFPDSITHAAKATRWVFKLAALSPRIKRIYFYHWSPAPSASSGWDSALVDKRGKPRPAYRVLRSHIVRARRARGIAAAL